MPRYFGVGTTSDSNGLIRTVQGSLGRGYILESDTDLTQPKYQPNFWERHLVLRTPDAGIWIDLNLRKGADVVRLNTLQGFGNYQLSISPQGYGNAEGFEWMKPEADRLDRVCQKLRGTLPDTDFFRVRMNVVVLNEGKNTELSVPTYYDEKLD